MTAFSGLLKNTKLFFFFEITQVKYLKGTHSFNTHLRASEV